MSRARISIVRLLCSFSRISQMWISLSRRSKRFRFRCKRALLPCGGTRVLAFLYSEAAEESVYDSACMKQVFQRAECCHGMCRESSLRLCKRGKVSPVRRDKRFTAVGQDQNEKQSTVSMYRSKNRERFTFKRMARTNNSNSLRKVLMMGSVSQFLLMDFLTNGL